MLYITALIYGKNKIRGEFKEYESKTLTIFKQHGGEIIAAYAPANQGEAETPDEIHILKIASRSAFDHFVNDPERIKLTDERNRVISKTEVYLSDEIIAY